MAAACERYASRMTARAASGETGADFDAALALALNAAQQSQTDALAMALDNGTIILDIDGARVDFLPRTSVNPREATYALAFDVDNAPETGSTRSYEKSRKTADKACQALADAALVRDAIIATVTATVADEIRAETADATCQKCASLARHGFKCRTHNR
jgi:hypothetical protein